MCREDFVILNVTFTTDENGKPLGATAMGHNITECKQLDETLREMALKAEKHASELDAVISSIAAGIIIYDNLGNIIRINEYANNLFGYSNTDYNVPYLERCLKLNLCKSDGMPYELEELPLYRTLQGEVIRDEEIDVYQEFG